ncbi:hypothetical protein [Amycolatopsis samaneae]|uniref:Serine/threonine protein kinase n=1 Tax=Amycolatopsis samaneae TaxID=664691 RepID=A0ABW5GJ58_9PSEU
MSKENEQTAEKKEEKPALRVPQILAAALAAVTAALVGSSLGVAGTVLGAAVASIVTTVGSELYLRSLHGTTRAARKARDALATTGKLKVVESAGTPPTPADLANQPTVNLRKPELEGPAEEATGKLRKLRWPLIIGTSLVAFVAAILLLFGVEKTTGKPIGGDGGIRGIFGDSTGQSRDDPKKDVPATGDQAPPPSRSGQPSPTTTPTLPPSSTPATPPPSTSSAPPTTSAPPSSTRQQPTTTPTPAQQPSQEQKPPPGAE